MKTVKRLWQIWLWLIVTLAVACNPLPQAPRDITLIVDGESHVLRTEAETVRDILNEANVQLQGLDRVSPPETTALTAQTVVTVIRVEQLTETFTETLPFGRQTLRDATIPEGETRLLEAGERGIRERVYRITLENGVETERALIQESIVSPPRDAVLLVGTRPQVQTVPITGTLVYLAAQDAWIMRENNRSQRRLTALGDLDGRVFDLSPDGTRLLFTRAVTEAEHINTLWVIGTTEVDAEPSPLAVDDVLWAGWAPDSARIAWTTAEVVERAPGWRGQNDLWTASISPRETLGTRRRILEPEAGGGYGWWGTRYAWSPTGDALAYSRPESVGVITLSPRVERAPLLTFPAYRTYSSWAWNPTLAWSPEGGFFATAVHAPLPGGSDPEESPVFDLWIVEATGAYSAALASEVGMWTTPQFAPQGAPLLFGRAIVPYQSEVSAYRLCTIDRDGSNRACIYPAENQPGINVPQWHWSPDGATLAFIQRGDITLLPLAAPTPQPLTDTGGITQIDWE